MDLMDWDCIDSSLFMDLSLDLHLFVLLDAVVSWLTSCFRTVSFFFPSCLHLFSHPSCASVRFYDFMQFCKEKNIVALSDRVCLSSMGSLNIRSCCSSCFSVCFVATLSDCSPRGTSFFLCLSDAFVHFCCRQKYQHRL